MSFWRGQISRIATAPLVAVCSGLVLAVIPLGDKLSPWPIVVFAAAILFRLLVNRRHWRLPSGPLRVAVLAAGVGGVAMGGFAGFESWLGILLVLLAMKLIETNSILDFEVLVLLGWFFCLCGLSFSQDLTTWLYLSGVALLLAGSLLRFHRPIARAGLGSAILPVLKMLGQATPIIALLFLFFPRIRGDFRIQFGGSNTALMGMGDQLSPGSVARLARNESIAFRAEFTDGNVPPVAQRYWRGVVLWHGEGLTWTRSFLQMRVERRVDHLEGKPIRQQIFLKPHGGRWLVALDRPTGNVSDATFEVGGFLQSTRPVVAPLIYTVISRPEDHETALFPIQRIEALRKPKVISPRVQALVDSWRGAGDREIIEAALRYFRQEKFVYSLDPGTYDGDALSEFLFERRTGFCEHFAAAFATLARLAGIPSRVVIGYHGGELGLGNYMIVRQLDAHAWAEVWLKGQGWQRIDPTNVVAPGRLVSGSESLLEQARQNAGAGDDFANASGLRRLMSKARLFWDRISYQWDLRIVSYDDSSQRSTLTLFGLERFSPPMIVFWLVTGIVFVLSLIGLWLARSRGGRKREPLVSEYQRFCRSLAAAGVAREPDEGPLTFSERAAIAFPHQARAIREIAAFYIAARYAGDATAAGHFKRAARALPRLDCTRASSDSRG